MAKTTDTRTQLLTASPFQLMLSLSIPAIIGMVVVGLYNFMDRVFVGQLIDEVAMGAVSVSYPFTLINTGVSTLIGVGSASVLSRAVGKKDQGTIDKIMGNLIALNLILGVIITITGMIFTRPILGFSGAEGEILNNAEEYLRIIFAGSLFVNFARSANMIMRGEGILKKAMLITGTGAVLNIILDPVMISLMKTWGNGVEGAAYATVISQIVTATITLWYFLKKSKMVVSGVEIGNFPHMAKRYIRKTLQETRNIDRRILFITYSGLDEEKLQYIKSLVQQYCLFERIYLQKASSAIASNCGSGSFGLLFLRRDDAAVPFFETPDWNGAA